MVRVITQEIEIEESLKKKIEFICSFCNTTPIIENGSLRTIERTNLAYVEPHRIIIKGITFLAFNYETSIYVEDLSKRLNLSRDKTIIFIKFFRDEEYNCRVLLGDIIDINYLSNAYINKTYSEFHIKIKD